jgi:hypothetical protein
MSYLFKSFLIKYHKSKIDTLQAKKDTPLNNDDFNYLVRRHEQLIKQLKENNDRMYALVMKKHEK